MYVYGSGIGNNYLIVSFFSTCTCTAQGLGGHEFNVQIDYICRDTPYNVNEGAISQRSRSDKMRYHRFLAVIKGYLLLT